MFLAETEKPQEFPYEHSTERTQNRLDPKQERAWDR